MRPKKTCATRRSWPARSLGACLLAGLALPLLAGCPDPVAALTDPCVAQHLEKLETTEQNRQDLNASLGGALSGAVKVDANWSSEFSRHVEVSFQAVGEKHEVCLILAKVTTCAIKQSGERVQLAMTKVLGEKCEGP